MLTTTPIAPLHLSCRFVIREYETTRLGSFTTLIMGSGGKTKGKRQAHSAKRYGKRMRALPNRMKDLDQIQVHTIILHHVVG